MSDAAAPARLPRLTTARLRLELLPPEAAAAVLDFRLRNREHLEPWEPPRGQQFLSLGFQEQALRQAREECLDGSSLRLWLLPREGSAVWGWANFTQIVRGPFQACYLGYGLDAARQGRGLMHEALEAATGFVFGQLGLHRIMANHLPENQRSARLLARLGFRVEGLAHDYLYIAGRWRDHVLTALTNPSMGPESAPDVNRAQAAPEAEAGTD